MNGEIELPSVLVTALTKVRAVLFIITVN